MQKTARHPLYWTWKNMRERCEKSYCKDYPRYGGRGVKVCKRWQTFINFAEDMGEKPEGMTLDRIDNNGDYEPSNCRWITKKEQTHNSRVVKLDYQKIVEIRRFYAKGAITQAKLAFYYGVHQSVISRILNGKIW